MTLKEAVLKKFHLVFKMNDKERNLILLSILDQIQQDNKDARDTIEIQCHSILLQYIYIVNLQLSFNKTFPNLQLHRVTRSTKKKKTPEIIKQELLASILKVFDEKEDYLQMIEEVKNAKEPKDGISLEKDYKYSWKTGKIAEKI